MSSITVGGLFVEIKTRTQGMTTMNLSPAERQVALAMGVPLEDAAALKRAHGRGGLAGIALHREVRTSLPRPRSEGSPESDQDEKAIDRTKPIFDQRPMGVTFPDRTRS